MGRMARQQAAAWLAALAAAWLALAALGYSSRDADSRLYAEIAARMADAPAAGWIAPDAPPGSYLSGPFREHPAGLFWPAALLARLGYPAGQAAYAMNALYQAATLLLLALLAASLVPDREARALAWLLQLLPIAFTYRARANHEAALLLGLVLALLGTELSRRRARWAALTAAGLVWMLLVKGVFAALGPPVCALWLVASRRDPERRTRAAWFGLAAAVLATAAAALVYEHLYRLATGEPFGSLYLARQLGVAAAAEMQLAQNEAWRKAANVLFYVGRILWFAFPWSLALLLAALRRRSSTTREPAGPDERGHAVGALFVAGTALVYVIAFSLFDRRADRYVFPAYYAVGAGGAIAALRLWPRWSRLAEALDRPWAPAAVFWLLLVAHVLAGRLGVPTIKL
jgi:4-amino-4-deoxy-L-arabinose transferase-like glycosyltransferase